MPFDQIETGERGRNSDRAIALVCFYFGEDFQ